MGLYGRLRVHWQPGLCDSREYTRIGRRHVVAESIFEAGSVVLEGQKKDGLHTVTLTADALSVDGKRGMKKYPLSRVSGYQVTGLSKTKVMIQIASEDDLELAFGGLSGKKHAKEFVEALKRVL